MTAVTQVSTGMDGNRPTESSRLPKLSDGARFFPGWYFPVAVSRPLVASDILFGALTTMRSLPVSLPFPVPANDLFGILFILVMLTRTPKKSLGRAGIVVIGALATLLYLVLVSYLGDVPASAVLRRCVHLSVVGILALFVGTGRADLRSVMYGSGVFLLINTAAFYAGLAPASYGRYLTGYLGDKNVAGLTVALVGTLLCSHVSQKYLPPVVVTTSILLWLTGSRTSLTAFAVAVVWSFLRPRLTHVIGRMTLGIFLVCGLHWLVDNLSQAGPFANRTGTDWFREQIAVAASQKVAEAPWYGDGLSTAYVTLDHSKFMLFHDSFLALRQEGGWPLTVITLGFLIWTGLRPDRMAIYRKEELINEAATIVLLVCAWKLGEVFFATISYLLYAHIIANVNTNLTENPLI